MSIFSLNLFKFHHGSVLKLSLLFGKSENSNSNLPSLWYFLVIALTAFPLRLFLSSGKVVIWGERSHREALIFRSGGPSPFETFPASWDRKCQPRSSWSCSLASYFPLPSYFASTQYPPAPNSYSNSKSTSTTYESQTATHFLAGPYSTAFDELSSTPDPNLFAYQTFARSRVRDREYFSKVARFLNSIPCIRRGYHSFRTLANEVFVRFDFHYSEAHHAPCDCSQIPLA